MLTPEQSASDVTLQQGCVSPALLEPQGTIIDY